MAWLLSLMASFATAALFADVWLDAIACLLSLIASFATVDLFAAFAFSTADCKLSSIASFFTPALLDATALEATAWLLSLMASFVTVALFTNVWLDAIACLLSLIASLATVVLFVSSACCEAKDCKLSLTAAFATFALFALLSWFSKAGSLEDSLLVLTLTLLSKLLFLVSNLLSFWLNSSTTFCRFSTRSSSGEVFNIAELLEPFTAWIFLSASEPPNAFCKLGSTLISKNLCFSNSCVAFSCALWISSLEPKSFVTLSVLLSMVRWMPSPTSDWSSKPSTTIPFCSCWLRARTCSMLYSKSLTSNGLIFFNSRTS